jgi:hypothetical protein
LGAEVLPIFTDSFASFGFMGTRFFAGFLATSFFNRAFFGTITAGFAFPDDDFFEISATVSFLIAINPPPASDYIKLCQHYKILLPVFQMPTATPLFPSFME